MALALTLAPGTFVRTALTEQASGTLEVAAVEREVVSEPPDGVEVGGVWDIHGSGSGFGGFSALVWQDDRLHAFSDRGHVLAFDPPTARRSAYDIRPVRPHRTYPQGVWDVESAVTAPDGRLWLGFEYTHAIHRFPPRGEADGLRMLGDEVDWGSNVGLEGMVRLPDGRFLLFPELRQTAHILARDPIAGTPLTDFTVEWPVEDHGVTDAALLPDGRLLVLLRTVDYSLPPSFSVTLAIADIGSVAGGDTLSPEILVRLDDIVPRENYEGIAVRETADGRAEIWLISDDNFSAFQRTLVVQLFLDLDGEQEKAREGEPTRAFLHVFEE
ncbi:esterase-like activity of phytase family protein [Aurantiacibacter gangjinensis]|nr:esterase-like activity of phytase family protein [Aurantiacibacter gangjinensis]APE27451.1 hypothetical protein BMF35_a0622 [Aurantiacibacter gangjinensis]